MKCVSKQNRADGFNCQLMYKTAVYRLVNGGITHQKQQISEKSYTTQQYMA